MNTKVASLLRIHKTYIELLQLGMQANFNHLSVFLQNFSAGMENSSQVLMNTPSASTTIGESILPDVMSQPSCLMQAGHSQAQLISFYGVDLKLTPKAYKELLPEDCFLMVSESLKNIIINTFNDDFRKQCFELLKV